MLAGAESYATSRHGWGLKKGVNDIVAVYTGDNRKIM